MNVPACYQRTHLLYGAFFFVLLPFYVFKCAGINQVDDRLDRHSKERKHKATAMKVASWFNTRSI